MGGFTDFLESGVLARTFGRKNFSYQDPSTHYYIGLATGTINESFSNLSTVEVAGGSYARVQYKNDTSTSGWLSPSNGNVVNRGIITFPTATASWGTVTDYFIARHITAVTGIVVIGTLSASKNISTGNVASFPSGEISIHLD